MKTKHFRIVLMRFFLVGILTACDETEQNPLTGIDNYVLSFSLKQNEQTWKAVLAEDKIILSVPQGTDLSNAVAQYTLSELSSITPDPASVTNWNKDQKFTVTSYNGTSRSYAYTIQYTQPIETPDDGTWSKAYVLCEGSWTQGGGSLPGKLFTYNNKWEQMDEPIEIGDTGNDLIRYGSKLYCAVSGNGLTAGNGGIRIFSVATGQSEGDMRQYDDEKNGQKIMPRKLVAHDGMVYISLYSGAVMAIDTTTYEKKLFKALDATYSEGIAIINNEVYVCNSGKTGAPRAGQGNTISKLSTDLKKETQITVPVNPKLVKQGPDGSVFFNCLGNFYDIKSALYKLDGNNYTKITEQVGAFAVGQSEIYTANTTWPDKNSQLQKISFGSVSPLTQEENIPEAMLAASVMINPYSKEVCFGQNNGDGIYIYAADGTPIRGEDNQVRTRTPNINSIVFVK